MGAGNAAISSSIIKSCAMKLLLLYSCLVAVCVVFVPHPLLQTSMIQ